MAKREDEKQFDTMLSIFACYQLGIVAAIIMLFSLTWLYHRPAFLVLLGILLVTVFLSYLLFKKVKTSSGK